jgi:DNA polymerase III epsilon subunit
VIFFDTETTGLIKNAALNLKLQPRIIEIGMVTDTGEQFSQLLDPGQQLRPIITKITGITDDDLKDAPTFDEIYSDLVEFMDGQDEMVAHNMPFDRQMLEFELRRMDVQKEFCWPAELIDTVQMAKPFYGGRYKKLDFLYQDLIGDFKQTHRAIEDCIMLQKVYGALRTKQEIACGSKTLEKGK